MRFPPPDPLSTILLYVGAIAMAANAALAPGTPVAKTIPVLAMSGAWPYVPVALMSVAAVIWIVRGLTGGSSATDSNAAQVNATAQTREPFLTPYLKTYVVIATMMMLMTLASTVISHLYSAAKELV